MGRKEKKYHYVYKTVNVLSGRYYLGMHSTDDLNDGYLGSGTRLRRAINKHGKDNFKKKILEFCKSRELLKKREEEIINLNEIAKVDCMNLKVGGYGGLSSEEHRKNFIKAGHATRVLHRERLKNDEDYRNKLIKMGTANILKAYKDGKTVMVQDNYDWTGKKHSEETKLKMSESNSGSNNSQFGKCWITNEKESKKIYRGDVIPEGWRLGRKMIYKKVLGLL